MTSNLSIFVLVTMLFLSNSCGVFERTTPIPKEKESFVGTWRSISGFEINIKSGGTADIKQITNQTDPDFDRLNIKVAASIIKDIRVKFRGNNILEVSKPLVYGKEFRIDKSPYQDSGQFKMVLNGVILVK